MSKHITTYFVWVLILCTATTAHAAPAHAPITIRPTSIDRLDQPQPTPATSPKTQPRFRHGDCKWVPPMALQAGWQPRDLPRLIYIIQRESGCCPNRRGGDAVNKDCEITRVTEWDHRSDTGLLQINGVHWKPDHPQYHGVVCKRMNICTQEPLLDPFTNLRAGRLLFDLVGWSPWDLPARP